MVLNPAIIALLIGSGLVALILAYASWHGIRIVRRFDLKSGSAAQLAMERRTYLISTIVAYAMVFQLISLFLYAYMGEHLHSLFVGAMCAAGTFNVNNYGYPTLTLKFVGALLSMVWLIVNHADNKGYDYPLIRAKYKLLAVIAVLAVSETLLQAGYFANMSPNLITSCCGTLFSEDAASVSGQLSALPPVVMEVVFFAGVVLVVRTGLQYLLKGTGAGTFAVASTLQLVVSIAAIVSFISVYYYELPTHHCPFCILQPEYGYIGYPLFFLLLVAGASGIGVGLLDNYRNVDSLAEHLPAIQRTLCIAGMIGYLGMAAIAAWPMLFSDFMLHGY
jgi:hypothetical protein